MERKYIVKYNLEEKNGKLLLLRNDFLSIIQIQMRLRDGKRNRISGPRVGQVYA